MLAGTPSAWILDKPIYMDRVNIFWWDTKLMQMFERELNHGREPSYESFCKMLIEAWADNGFHGCNEWMPKSDHLRKQFSNVFTSYMVRERFFPIFVYSRTSTYSCRYVILLECILLLLSRHIHRMYLLPYRISMQGAKSDLVYFEQLHVEDWPATPYSLCPLCGDNHDGVYERPLLLLDPDFSTSTSTPFDNIHPHPKRINHTHFPQINFQTNIYSPGNAFATLIHWSCILFGLYVMQLYWFLGF
jgi:hypothetical protein